MISFVNMLAIVCVQQFTCDAAMTYIYGHPDRDYNFLYLPRYSLLQLKVSPRSK